MQKACPPYLLQLYLLIITYFFPSHLLCHLEYFCVLVVEHRITHKHTQKQPKGARVPDWIQTITKKEDKASMIFISTYFIFRYTTREQTSLEVDSMGRRWQGSGRGAGGGGRAAVGMGLIGGKSHEWGWLQSSSRIMGLIGGKLSAVVKPRLGVGLIGGESRRWDDRCLIGGQQEVEWACCWQEGGGK